MNKSLLELEAIFRKMTTFFLLMLCAILNVNTLAGAGTSSNSTDIQTVADWIISLQYINPNLPNYGAIKIHHEPGDLNGNLYFNVVPYYSNLGVLGLLLAPVKSKLEVAERWINWYLRHLNANGTMYDYWYLQDGTRETTCRYNDSEDSYAATFLGVAWTYYEEGGSATFLNAPGNKEKFETIAGVILSLQDKDGLTWAKEDYRVKYLMDNSEVYWGLLSMAKLEAVVFGDLSAAKGYVYAADKVRKGIYRSLLDRGTNLYHVAKFEDGTCEEADLNIWYPGTVAIAWPHLFGVIESNSEIATFQMASLNDSWDGSPNPDWVCNIVDATGYLWPSIGYATLLTGNWEQAIDHTNFVKSLKFPTKEDPVGFSWQFGVDDGGWLLRTLSALNATRNMSTR